MPEEPPTPPPETPAPHRPGQHVGTAFSGETTGSVPNLPTGDETVLMGSGAGAKTEVIGDFEVLGKLGQGGMGAVYRARQRSLDRQVALKILPATLEADADFVSRFQREARVAANLNHANLVKVYASGQADGCHFIAMELIEGETLGQWLKRGALPPPEALRICGDVARALEHGWNRAQLIHRDIKPGNIFLSIHGDVKVGDLGLAKSLSGDTTGLTQTGTAMGTPHYISPEQARGDSDLDFRADIYSLGCTLYQMLTGRTPYTGSDPMAVMSLHRDAPPPAILKVLPSCPIPLARLVGKMLKKNKRERHASYGDLIAEIERARAIFAPATSVLEATLPPDPDATQLATPGHTPRSATPVTAPLARTSPPIAAAKSKAPLYGGLVAGVVVLGVVAFLVWPKQEKLTKAELYAKQREAEQAAAKEKAGGTGSSASPTSAGDQGRTGARPSAALPVPIKLWNSPDTIPAKPGVTWAEGALRLDKSVPGFQSPTLNRPLMRDVAFRGTLRLNPEAEFVLFAVRFGGTLGTGLHGYRLGIETKSGVVRLESATGGQSSQLLQKWTLTRPLGADQWMPVELRVAGDEITVSTDGAILGKVRDNSVTEAGQLQVFPTGPGPGYIRDIEYIPLDGAAATSATAAESWQDVLREPARFGLSPTGVERSPDGLRFTSASSATLHPGKGPEPDGAIRARMIFGGVRIQLRARANSAGLYMLSCRDQSRVWLERWDAAAQKSHKLREFVLPRPLQPGEEYELALRVVGETFTASFNGAVLGTASDSTFPTGRFAVATFDVSAGPCLVKTMEVLDLAGPTAPATSPAEPWQDVLKNMAKATLSGAVKATPEGLLWTGEGSAMRHSTVAPRRDGAIRLKSVWGGVRPALRVRSALKPGVDGMYQLTIWKGGTKAVISRYDNAARQTTTLDEFILVRPLKDGEPYELELRIIGQTFTAKFNGEVMGNAIDGTYSSGIFGLGVTDKEGAPTLVKSLEVLDLDAPAAGAESSAEPWQNLLSPSAVPELKLGAKIEGAELILPNRGNVRTAVATDGAIRASGTYGSSQNSFSLAARDGLGIRYGLTLKNASTVRLFRTVAATGGETVELGAFPLPEPLKDGDSYELELRAVGTRISALSRGSLLGAVEDSSVTSGQFGVYNFDSQPARISRLEYLRLSKSAADTPAAATTDAPFVNSLGMKFVPVPITGGPTNGQRVLFSIWETRVQDYEVFANEVGRAWSKPSFKQGPMHVVINVSWEDTQAFCAWLTERERKAGRIGLSEAYRPPSDHEWSCAIGLGDREDPTKAPMDKDGQFPDLYVWGTGWPPPAGIGNFRIDDLPDGYPDTAPVGSFAPNALGLYDLAGNAWEWCDDLSHRVPKENILRGAAYTGDPTSFFLASHRISRGNAYRSPTTGFRVVLAPVP